MIQLISTGAKKNIRCYLDWGTYESKIMASNLEMLDAMRSNSYSVQTFQYHEGHSWGNWRAHTDDLLKAFF